LRVVLGLSLLFAAPAEAASKIAASGRYVCDDGSLAAFTEAPYGPSMRWDGREVRLAPRAVFSGFGYRGDGLTLRGRGKEGDKTLVISGAGADVTCNAVPAVATPGVAAGIVTARLPMTLPKGAMVLVQLRDTARADAPAPLLGEVKIRPRAGRAPIHWWLRYDAKRAVRPAQPALSARITDAEGRLIWVSDTFTPLPVAPKPGFAEGVISVVPVKR
jgi:putative lipoprotein